MNAVYAGLNQMKLEYQVWFMWSFKSLFRYYKTFTVQLGGYPPPSKAVSVFYMSDEIKQNPKVTLTTRENVLLLWETFRDMWGFLTI